MPQRIIVASGIEIRDAPQEADLVGMLNTRAQPNWVWPPGLRWTFPRGPVAAAKFEIELVHTMAEFRTALEERDAWVIYSGHSRYGQGPAFGPANTAHCPTAVDMPVNPWGQHFRMGWDATDTECMGDILEHGVAPRELDITAANPGLSLPSALVRAASAAKDVERMRRRGKLTRQDRRHPCNIRGAWRNLHTCHSVEAEQFSLRPDQPILNRNYYAQITVGGTPDFLTAVTVGHGDLDTVNLRCAVLFMGSCSSNVHYRHSLVNHRTTQRANCWFYLTMRVNSASHAATFVDEALNGTDPLSRGGARTMIWRLNSQPDPGTVVVVKP